jgi:hypothetical protein
MFSQGYIGITNKTKQRWATHKNKPANNYLKNAIHKYGWDNLIKEVILISDKDYCINIETQLRPTDKIGWNLVKGGGLPPITKFNLGKNLSSITKQKISISKQGQRHSPEVEKIIVEHLIKNGINTRFKKGMTPWNKGLKMNKQKGIKNELY